MNPPHESAPSRIRYLIVFLATLMAVLLYLDRFSITLLERYVTADLGLSNEQSAIYLAMFFYAYALAQVPSGWLTDRFGARLMLTIYILGWSFFTAAMGFVHGFIMLLVIRIVFGITQAGAYPTAANLLSRWMPLSARGKASGIVSFGGRIGGAIVPVLTGILMVMLVPATESSLFAPGEVRNAKLFAVQLSGIDSEKEPTAEVQGLRTVVSGRLPDDLKNTLQKVSGNLKPLFVELETQISKQETDQDPKRIEELKEKIHAQLHEQPDEDLNEQLNEKLDGLLTLSDLFGQQQIEKLQLPDEAVDILKQPSPTQQETERLNRLVLEELFPGAFKEVYGRSWRSIVMIYGLLGFAVGLPFWFYFRNRPQEHPRCNEAEVALIRGPYAIEPSHPRKLDAIPWTRIILSFSVWCCCLVQIGTNIGWTFIVTWMPRYLQDVHSVPLTTRALMTSLPMICGIAGNFFGGFLTDAVTRRFGPRLGRSLPVALTRFMAGGAFLLCLYIDSAWGFTILMCVMAFSVDLGIASIWAFNQDIGGRYVATVLGWGNMWGNLAAGVSPMLLNYTTVENDWNPTFLTCAGCLIAAGAIAFGINASISIDKQSEKKDPVS